MITISNKKDCSGCHACASICPKQCISMEPDSEGFWYPVVDAAKCISCEACIKVCPVLNHTVPEHEPAAYACYNKNGKTRQYSSSGGIFTIMAKQVLWNGGIVFGASYNEAMEVVHTYTDNTEDLKKFRGSKYVQSRIGDAYRQAKEFLLQGRNVLFSGTPCQISGLKSYLGKPYSGLLCVDLICHGVPSPKVLRKYITRQEELSERTITRIAFRNKKTGWKQSCVLTEYSDGTKSYQKSAVNLYMKLYRRNIMLRPSCYSCVHKQAARESDITIADFWGIQHLLPEMDDDKGTSLLLVQSEAGRKMFEMIHEFIHEKEVLLKDALAYNRSAIRSTACHPKREFFFEKLDSMPLHELVSLCLKPNEIELPDAAESMEES